MLPRTLCAAPALALVTISLPALGADVPVDSSMSQGDINAAIASLAPGDTLLVGLGDYQGITLDLTLTGTAEAPITVRGDGGRPRIIANADGYQEAVRIRPGSAYLVLESLELTMTGTDVQAGIYFDDGVHDITIRDCEIHHVTGIGIQIQTRNDVHDVLVESSHIHHTGENLESGSNGGQAFTAGGFDAGSATTGVYHLGLRHNLIHDTRGQEGDCLKFMYGVYASVMEDNVLYNCPRGVAQEENYGVTSYGSGVGHYQNAADNNLIRRNLLVGTAGVQDGERNVAIYAGPGTLVENNLVITADIGIAARLESEASALRNLVVVHNTVFDVTDHAFSIRSTDSADSSVIVANNAFFTGNDTAFGYRWPEAIGGTVAEANYYTGQDYAEVGEPAMIRLSGTEASAFVALSSSVPGADFMPAAGGPLVDVGSSVAGTTDDFDLAARPVNAGPDVGAYELRDDLSDHWAITLDVKGSSGTGGFGAGPGTGGSGAGTAQGGSGTGAQGAADVDDGEGGASDDEGCGCRLHADGNARWSPLLGVALAAWAVRRRRGGSARGHERHHRD